MKLPAKLIGAAVLAAVILTGCDLIEKPNTDKHKQHTESVPNQQGNNNGEAQGGSGSNSGGSSGGENATPDSGYDTYSSVEECTLNFDHAMAENLTPAEYVVWAKTNPAQAITALKLKLQKSTNSTQHKTVIFGQENGGYLKINNIGPYIYNKQITADDVAGTLTFDYVIASADDITEASMDANKMSKTEPKTLSGFQQISEVLAKDLFQFAVMRGTGIKTPEEKLIKWKNKNITDIQGRLLSEAGTPGETGWSITKNTEVSKLLSQSKNQSNENGYYVTLNGDDIGDETFLGDSVRKISKGNGGKNILVKGVTFTKKGGEEKLTITMTFCKGDSGETMSWDVQPNTSGN